MIDDMLAVIDRQTSRDTRACLPLDLLAELLVLLRQRLEILGLLLRVLHVLRRATTRQAAKQGGLK